METMEYFEKEMFFENLPVLPYPEGRLHLSHQASLQ